MWLSWGKRGMRLIVSNNLMLLLLLLLLIQPAEAKTYAGVDDALICQTAAAKFEKQYQIKEHMLTTITNVETGRWNKERQQTLGWPWTINAQGKGYFFKTKAEAVRKVKELQRKGVKSIDVGCMQINLMYHGSAFKSVEEALDPDKNVEYGAKYLTKLYKQKGKDWFKAAMAYHSNVLKKALKNKKKLVVAYAKLKKQNSTVASAANSVKANNQDKKAAVQTAARETRAAIKANAWREQKLAEYQRGKIN